MAPCFVFVLADGLGWQIPAPGLRDGWSFDSAVF